MKRIGFAVGLLGLLLVVIKVGGQTQPSLLQNGWLAGNTVPTSCSSGVSPNFYNTSTGSVYQCVGNGYVQSSSGSFSTTNQNSVGADILNGRGNFAVNGLTGWTAATGSLSDWSIVSGNLHHIPTTGGDGRLQTMANVVLNNAYLGTAVVVSQSAGNAWFNLGDNCNSDCADNFTVGVNQYYALDCCDSGSTPIQIDVSADSDITISSFKLQPSIPTIWNTAGTGNISIGFDTLLNVMGGVDDIAIGSHALNKLTAAFDNTAVGYTAGRNLTTGDFNTLYGFGAGRTLTTGAANVLIGVAGGSITTGNNNLGFGNGACTNIITGGNNMCLGNYSGPATLNGDNKLYIEMGIQSDTPLIGGDFTARTVGLDATVNVNHGGVASTLVCWMSDGKGIGHCTGSLSGVTCACAQ